MEEKVIHAAYSAAWTITKVQWELGVWSQSRLKKDWSKMKEMKKGVSSLAWVPLESEGGGGGRSVFSHQRSMTTRGKIHQA